jgi:transmembrane protein 216
MEALKFVNLKYENEVLYRELIIVLALLTLESVRIYLGKQGSLSDHGKIL